MSRTGTRAAVARVAGAPATRVVAVVLVAAAVLVAILLALFVPGPSRPAALLDDPVTVKRALSTTAALFGDPVQAEIDVYTRDSRVAVGSVRVRTAFGHFTVVAKEVAQSSLGDHSLMRTRLTLRCLTRACLPPQNGGRLIQFPPFVVSYREDGRMSSTPVPWDPVQLSSRLPSGSARGLGVIDTAPPLDPRFARSPGLVRFLLLLATVILGLGGAVLVASALWPRPLRARRWERLSPLERSLAVVEAAARSDDEAERRRALDQLALRLHEVSSPRLEGQTRELAWGESPPEADALVLLAQRVRTSLNGGVQA